MIGSRYIGSIINNAPNVHVLELTLETNRQCIGCVLSYVKLEQNYVKFCQIRRKKTWNSGFSTKCETPHFVAYNQGSQITHVSPHCHVT